MSAGYLVVAAVAAFFLLRPEIWQRLFFTRIDPRPAGLTRIAVALVSLWNFITLGPNVRLFFSDEGFMLPGMAREISRGPMRYLWDPASGFEHWWSPLQALAGSSTILHLRSDPPLVFAIYGLLLLSLALMAVGLWTGVTSVAAWALAAQLYRYDPMFANGGDLVVQALLFLGMLSCWGEAYSIDVWRRRRRALLDGAEHVPALRRIPAWPLRLMMLQLAIIYFLNGWTKTGAAWREGTALYYALNLDHFYRVPAQTAVTWLQYLGVLPAMTWLTRWWELLFPLALLGAALRAYEAERAAGRWPDPPAWRRVASWGAFAAGIGLAFLIAGEPAGAATVLGVAGLGAALYQALRARWPAAHRVLLEWLLGKRVWLVMGLGVHLGIDIGMNIGTFPQIMMAAYLCWLSGPEVEAFWRFLLCRAAPVTVRHRPDEASVRQASLLRLWDYGRRLEFAADAGVEPRALRVEVRGSAGTVEGERAALALLPLFPVLWWLRPLSLVPGLRAPAGRVALRLMGQSASG